MKIRTPIPSDWQAFVELATQEQWRVPYYELALFKGTWSRFSYAADTDGFHGLVTAVAYETSAWIGNLLVPGSLRGRGYGSGLFNAVLAKLLARGIASIWLTASEQGRGIYVKAGFKELDRIERWILPPHWRGVGTAGLPEERPEELCRADRLAWNDNRTSLLNVLCDAGPVIAGADNIALLQRWPDVQIIGPWYASRQALPETKHLLDMILVASDPGLPVVVDAFASSSLPGLCSAAGFRPTGRTSLMACGDIEPVNRDSMLSLASLGSVG